MSRSRLLIAISMSAALAGLWSAGCTGYGTQYGGGNPPSEEGATSSSNAPVPVGAAATPPFDLQKVIQRAHFAFRPEGAGFEGGHSTYQVNVSRRGEIAFTRWQRSHGDQGNTVSHSAAFMLETTQIERGGSSIAPAVAQGADVEEDGTLALQRGTVVERLHNEPRGLEQSWTFANRPAGEGGLTVHLKTGGMAYLGRTESDLRFLDRASNLGVRYGEAVWIDANGDRTPLAVGYTGGDVTVSVPADVLERSSYPAVLDPSLGSETPIDSGAVGPEEGFQAHPDVACSSATQCLAVWNDSILGGLSNAVYGARFNPSTFAIVTTDTRGLRIATGTSIGGVAVAWNSTASKYGIAWNESGSTPQIRFAQVGTSAATVNVGTVNAPTDTGPSVGSPTLATNGADFLAVWHYTATSPSKNEYDYAHFTGTTGLPATPAKLANTTTVGTPDAVWDGNEFQVVWPEGSFLRGATITPGTPWTNSATNTLSDVSDPRDPEVACIESAAPHDCVAAYQDGPGTSIRTIKLVNGNPVLNGTGKPDTHIIVSSATSDTFVASVAWGGAGASPPYFVAWQQGLTGSTSIVGRRLNSDGTAADASNKVVYTNLSTKAFAPSVGRPVSGYITVFGVDNNNGSDIYGASISLTGTVSGSSLLSQGGATERNAAIAYLASTDQYYVFWQDDRNGTFQIMGAPVDTSGLFPGSVVSISGGSYATLPQVAVDTVDNLMFVVFQYTPVVGTSQVYGIVVDSTLAAVSGFASLGNGSAPVVGFDGDSYAVAWESSGNVVTRAVSLGGVVGSVTSSLGTGTQPAIACSGASNAPCLVAWRQVTVNNYDVVGRHIKTSSEPFAPQFSILSTGTSQNPAMAFAGGKYLIVGENGSSPTNLRGALVQPTISSATALGSALATAAGAKPINPAVGTDGANFLVVWEDLRGGSSQVYGRRVSPTGAILGLMDDNLSGLAGGGNEHAPALASAATDFYLIVSHHTDMTATYRADRVYTYSAQYP